MWLLWCALGILALLLAVGGYTFFTACYKNKEVNWLDEAALQGTPYGQYASQIRAAHHWLQEHNAVDVWTQSHDGRRLHGCWVPAADPKGTIILAHGYRSTKYLEFGMVLELYHNLGMNMLLIDQRAHGQSEGKYITFGVLESRDLQSWIRFHNKTFGGHPTILSGLSMGAATVMYTADRELPENVKGIIADCGFTSPGEIIAKVCRDVIHISPKPFMWATDLFARVFAGFSLYERDSRKTLKKSRLPVFLVHGRADDFVPCYMTEQSYAACTSEKELFLVDGAAHGCSYLTDSPGYRKRIIAFLRKYINEEI